MTNRVLLLWLGYWSALCGFAGPLNGALRNFPSIVGPDVTPLLFMGALLFWVIVCGLQPQPDASRAPADNQPAPPSAAVRPAPRALILRRCLLEQGEWLMVILLSLSFGLAVASRVGTFAPEGVIRSTGALFALIAFVRALAALSGGAYFLLLTLLCGAYPLCLWLANQTELARTGRPLADFWLTQIQPLRLLSDPVWNLPQIVALVALLLFGLLIPLLARPQPHTHGNPG